MYKILVPTDFSTCAKNAEDVALQIAEKVGGEVHFYHKTNVLHDWQQLTEEQRKPFPESAQAIKEVEANFAKLLAAQQKAYPNVAVKTIYSHGRLIENISDYIDSFNIDLLVMGSHGASGYNEWMIGSNTQKVVRLAHCPVLTIKNEWNKLDIKHIAFASNFDSNLKVAFEKVIQFAQLFDAQIHLLTIDTPAFYTEPQSLVLESMETFKKLCKGRVKCTLHSYYHMTTFRGIRDFTVNNTMDMVAIATHGRQFLGRLFFGSFAETLVNHLETPLLTVNIKGDVRYET